MLDHYLGLVAFVIVFGSLGGVALWKGDLSRFLKRPPKRDDTFTSDWCKRNDHKYR